MIGPGPGPGPLQLHHGSITAPINYVRVNTILTQSGNLESVRHKYCTRRPPLGFNYSTPVLQAVTSRETFTSLR